MEENIPVPILERSSCRLSTCAPATVSKAAMALLTLITPPMWQWAVAQGIPEPSLVMYGVVRNAQDPDRLRVTFGNLTWFFQPAAGGTAFTVTATLTNINDQFSYVLRVPCETDAPGI